MFMKKFGFTLAEGATHVNSPQTKAKFGFTLAEVLITLGIIGVVAAITIPNLIANQQKKAIGSQIAEAQSILTQAVRQYTADTDEEGSAEFDTTLSPQAFAEKYFKPYLKIARICTRIEDGCWKTGDFNGYYDLAGHKMTNVPYSIVLNNGMILGFSKIDGHNLFSIFVDVNGQSKRNVLGKDVFSFYPYNSANLCNTGTEKYKNIKNGIYPGGFDSCGTPHVAYSREELLTATNILRNCNKVGLVIYSGNRPGLGAGCAAVIFKDGWKISNDYPWN